MPRTQSPVFIMPHDLAISKQEEAILWRSVERIPEIHPAAPADFILSRAPKSVDTVAANLELSEDAMHTARLSRGRKLLQEQVLAFVEGALARTNPGQAFTLGVLAALPITLASSAKAASMAPPRRKGARRSRERVSLPWCLAFYRVRRWDFRRFSRLARGSQKYQDATRTHFGKRSAWPFWSAESYFFSSVPGCRLAGSPALETSSGSGPRAGMGGGASLGHFRLDSWRYQREMRAAQEARQ